MPLLPLEIPPGVVANGTELQSAGRWRDASLVRWVDGAMRPVGGWRTRLDTTVTTPRAVLAWQDNSGFRRFAVAGPNKLVSITAAGTITDITPAGIVPGSVSGGAKTGYGMGPYGSGPYGAPRPDPGTYSEATTWSLDTWGEQLVACSVADGRLLAWDLNGANDATPITNAPVDCLGLIVTEERFLFALGAGGDPRLVQWCDREDYTTWTPAATNEAGDYPLQTAGQIMGAVRVQGGTLILTDDDAHFAQYQGPPFVYGFQRVGTSCGAVSRKAAVSVGSQAFWMGQQGFFVFNGATVDPLACTVTDKVFGDLSRNELAKIVAVSNSQFSEVWWFYPSGESLENDRYVAFNYLGGFWMTGQLARTCGVNRGVFAAPIWLDVDGIAYDHETGWAKTGSPVYAEVPLNLGPSASVVYANEFIPDEATQGDLQTTFRTKFHPNGAERSFGPYSHANPTSVRFAGKHITMRLDEVRAGDWRAGVNQLDFEIGGKR